MNVFSADVESTGLTLGFVGLRIVIGCIEDGLAVHIGVPYWPDS